MKHVHEMNLSFLRNLESSTVTSPHLPPSETDASFFLSSRFPSAPTPPLFRIDLLLMPKRHTGRLTKGSSCMRAARQASPSPKQEVWFTSAVGRDLSSGALGANGSDLCAPLLLLQRGTSVPSLVRWFYLCFDD